MRLADLRALHADRFRLAGWLLLPVLALGGLLRVALYSTFHDGPFRPASLLFALTAGLVYDLFATLILLAPALALLACLRLRFLAKSPWRALFLGLFYSALLFDTAAEYFFFEEFNARYNHIALDYVLYPTEVFTNIRESYDVPLVAGLSIGLGTLAAFLASRRMRDAEFGSLPWAARWRALAAIFALVGLSSAVYRLLPAEISPDRVTSEVAHNGPAQLVRAYLTSELDFEAYYRTISREEARSRASAVLGFATPSRDELALPFGEFALRQEIRASDGGGERPLDVLLVLEESFGSSFVGVLGHPEKGCTPHFDRWSREGLLLTHLVATGNRTVRGLEAVLCSFVPLPGDSIVKRTRQKEVACLAQVLAGRGFETSFFYGGYGLFDHMKPFMLRNGFQEFIEEPDYPKDAFRTAWGVADEYIFDAVLDRQVRAAQEKTPFFATLLSVSNHRPYDVPGGRTGRPDGEKSRTGAVAYADWCIGRYLDRAREKGVLDHTVVLIVGDHGARIYGSEQIPVSSYRIPALFLSPDSSLRGRRIDRLCSQIDLAPTLLSLAGVACTAPFLGQDLSRAPDGPGRAFVHHDRDIGMLTDDTLVVLGLRKTTIIYTRRDRDHDDLFRLPEAARTPGLRDLERDTIAVFQTASEMYCGGKFVLRESDRGADPGAGGIAPACEPLPLPAPRR